MAIICMGVALTTLPIGSNWDDPPSCNLNRALYFQKMTSTKFKLFSFERQIYEQVAVDEFTPMETTARVLGVIMRGKCLCKTPWRLEGNSKRIPAIRWLNRGFHPEFL